nr:hypothetical protein CFP56_05764 [Quercus suber]
MSFSEKETGLQSFVRSSSKSTKMSMMEWRPFNQASLEFQAFTTGGSKYPNKSSGVEIGDTATHLDEVELTSSPTKGVQSDTAMNISRASLKRIDLALRAKLEARQNNVENATHPTNDNEDQMQVDSRNDHNDNEMCCDEGSDSHLS